MGPRASTKTTNKRGAARKAGGAAKRAPGTVIDAGPAGPDTPQAPVPQPMMKEIDATIPEDFVPGNEDDYTEEDVDLDAVFGDGFHDTTQPVEQFGMPPENVGAAMTTTENFMGSAPTIVREVVDTGVKMVDGERVYRVRTVIDVGPVYYGPENLIELKKGRLYEVPESIYRYLREKDLLWEQQ